MKRSTVPSGALVPESHWEGLILSRQGLSGDIFTVDGIKYLVQSAVADPASGETFGTQLKLTLRWFIKAGRKADKDYNLIGS